MDIPKHVSVGDLPSCFQVKEHFNESRTNNTCEKEHLGCTQCKAYAQWGICTLQLEGSSFDICQGDNNPSQRLCKMYLFNVIYTYQMHFSVRQTKKTGLVVQICLENSPQTLGSLRLYERVCRENCYYNCTNSTTFLI